MKMKKNKQRILSLILMLAMIIGMLPSNVVVASAEETKSAQVNAISTNINSSKVAGNPSNGKWDYVSFGSYPQSEVKYYSADIINGALDAGDKGVFYVGENKYKRLNDKNEPRGFRVFKYEPIKWRVLRNDGEKLYLLSENIICNIDWYSIGGVGRNAEWEWCYLRRYLNNEFIQDALDAYEKSILIETKLSNPFYPVTNGNSEITHDKVWILSRYDMDIEDYGFKNVNDRMAYETEYAKLERINNDGIKDVNYITRTNVNSGGKVLVYDNAGGYYEVGYNVYCGVRPAIMIPVGCGGYNNTTLEEEVPLSFFQDNYGYQIQNQLPDLSYDAGTLKGPEIDIMGNKVNLFDFAMKLELSLGDDSKVKGSVYYDPEKQTVKYMLGISEEEKAKLDASVNEEGDSYWKTSYQQLKTYVQKCGKITDGKELYNDFRTLRKQLKKTNASLGLATEGYIAGYLEYSVANGKLEFVEGAITATMETSVKAKLPIYGSVIYAEIGLSGEVGSELVIKTDTMNKIALVGKVNLALKPSAGIVADLKVIEGKAIFSGDLGIDINFPFKSPEESIQAYMQGKFTASVNSPLNIVVLSKTWKFPKMELYPNLGKIIEDSSFMAYNMRLLSAAVDEIPVEGLIEFAGVVKDTPVYENAKPQLVELSDGRKLLIYIDDDGTKSEGNHTTLMYSIQEDGVWSTPVAVNETGRADSAPVVCYDGTGVHVIWLNVAIEVTEEQLDEVLSNVDLCYTYFDGTEFGETMIISEADNGKIEYYYSIAAKEGETTIMWVDNSENDFMMTSGTNTVYKRIITEEGLGDITTAASATTKITQTACDYISDTLYSAYIKNGELYVGSTSYKSKATNVSNIEYIDDKLYYLNDTLKYYNNSKSIDTGVVPSSRFTVVGDKVYWLDYDGDYCEIFAQTIGEDNVAMVTDDNGHINSMSLIEKADGKTAIAYIYQNLNVNFEDDVDPFGTSFMKYYEKKDLYDLSIERVSYDCMDIVNGGEISVDFEIRNNGVSDIEGAVIKISDPNYKTIDEIIISDTIASGNVVTKSVVIDLPDDISGYYIMATVSNDEIIEYNTFNNSCTIEMENTDVSMTIDDEYNIVVENTGNCEARNVSLYVYEDSAYGNLLTEISIGDMKPKELVSYTDSDLIKTLEFEDIKDAKNYYYVVETESYDINQGNNSLVQTRKPILAEKITVDNQIMNLYVGESKQLKANIYPLEAYFKDIIWTSSDENVATVSSNGRIKAVSDGVTFIRAETKAEGIFALCAVQVKSKKSFEVKDISDYEYTGKAITPDVEVYSGSKSLIENVDYIVTFSNNINAGIAKVVVSGIGDYDGKITKTFAILPSDVTGFTYSDRTSSTITLKWTKNSSADGYVIEQYKNDKWVTIKTITDEATISHKVSSLTPSVTYKFRIRAYKNTGTAKVYGDYATKNVKTLPSTITGFTYSARTAASVSLKWTKNTSADGYVIEQYKSGKWTTIKTITKNSTVSHKVTGLKAGTSYKFRIRAYKMDGSTELYSASYTTKTVKTLPSTVKSFTYKARTKTSIALKWAKNTSADGYVIQQYKGGKWTTIKTITKNSTVNHKVTGLKKGTTYKFRIRAYKKDGSKKLYSVSYTTKSIKTL